MAGLGRKAPHVEEPEVSILVPVHGTIDEAAALLASIVRHTVGAYEIVVVDNGSGAGAADALKALTRSFGARLVRLNDNVVYGHVVNLGLAKTRGRDVCLLNSDVIVTPAWLTNLLGALHSSPDIGIVGPRSNYARWQQGGIWLDDLSLEAIERFGRFFNYSDPSRWFEIDWLSGYAMLFSRATVQEVGGFDERVPWYAGEDRVLCERVRGAGYRVLCAGDTFVYHAGHRTFMQAGLNRTALRFGRQPRQADDRARCRADRADGAGGLLREGNQVFEVLDGVASHVENGHLLRLVRAGRPLREAAPDELAQLPVGPPISACRVRGTDEVWVLRAGARQRVRGDSQRIRRLQALSVVEPGELDGLPRAEDLSIEDAVLPVPEIAPLLPSNPAAIEPERLAGADAILAGIASAVQDGRGHAVISLDLQSALILNDGMWPAETGDWWRHGIGGDSARAAAAIRRAIIDADAVGVATDRAATRAPELLERVLFHHDLYPRLRYPAELMPGLMNPIGELLRDRPVAVVCPAAIADVVNRRAEAEAVGILHPRIAVALDDLTETERALAMLARARESFDAVLVASGAAGIPLCSALARELDAVAIDLGRLGGVPGA